ncbi:hypothetical protein JHK87_052434 [Glycine soja]|nr:hypothetical protein JHK87_052434 [Glycine soja]
MDEKGRLKSFFKVECAKVALTTKCWTSIQNLNYLTLTYHFIDTEWKFVRSSPQRSAKFKEWIEFLGISWKKLLCLDVSTRWNSSYLKLDAAKKYQEAFEKIRKYEKYWGDIDKVNNFLYFGVMFDPDFKHEILMWSFVTLFKYNNIFTEKLCTSIRKNCKKAYKEQTKSEQSSHGLGNFASAAKTSVCAETSSYLARTNAFKRHLAEKDSIDIQNEFERYLAEKCVDVDDSFDVLVWWKQNASRFPTLSRMVKDILATPISIVASESDFSIGGRVIDCFRSSLNPQMEEALIFAQNWLRPILAQLKGLKIIEDIEISEAQ